MDVGTDRISAARDLEAVRAKLSGRGAELMRIDVEAARRLGAKFLEHGDVVADLNKFEAVINEELAAARTEGKGKKPIAKLEERLAALKEARDFYVETYKEGHGVGSIPSRSMTRVEGASVTEAVAGERALLAGVKVFRYGGRVLLVAGIGASIARVASAPEGQVGRVAAEETGGWAFSLAGAGAGVEIGGEVGIAVGWESGPGAVACAILGSLIFGAIGFLGGETAVGDLYDGFDVSRWLNEAFQSDYRHFKTLNPDATPADYDRLQDVQDRFDAGELF